MSRRPEDGAVWSHSRLVASTISWASVRASHNPPFHCTASGACRFGRPELEKLRMSNPVRIVLGLILVVILYYLVITLARGVAA